jgi:hypothetical protein
MANWNQIHLDSLSNQLSYLVQEAYMIGCTPEEFKDMVATAWRYALQDEAKRAEKVLRGK